MRFKVRRLGWGAAMAQGWDKALIVAVSFVLLAFTQINPADIILGTVLLGFLIYR